MTRSLSRRLGVGPTSPLFSARPWCCSSTGSPYLPAFTLLWCEFMARWATGTLASVIWVAALLGSAMGAVFPSKCRFLCPSSLLYSWVFLPRFALPLCSNGRSLDPTKTLSQTSNHALQRTGRAITSLRTRRLSLPCLSPSLAASGDQRAFSRNATRTNIQSHVKAFRCR